MADPVEISNVGGYRGVASEATLLALVDSIRRQGIGGSANTQMVTRLQNLHNRAISEGTREVKAFDKAISTAADTVSDFTKELLVGGERVSDFADAILGSQNVLARFIGFVEGTFDQFRNLASVGATFNNSFLQMISTSSEASMTIDGFTELVRNNSNALASFGGTVTNGAQYFARFSRDFRLGVGQRFFEMGFTIADINEGLIGFLDLERMRSSRQLRSDAELQEGAANYLLQLDRLAKITGRQRKELEDVMQRQLQDAGIRAQMNRLDGQAQENFRDVLTFMQTELPGLSDGLIDLMDGVAQTDLGRALQSQLPGITGFMQEAFAGGASLEEFMDMLANRYGPRLDGLANSFSAAQLQSMRMAGGVQAAIAEMIDAGYQVNRATSRDARAAREEAAAQADILTRTFGRFEQAIIEIRKFLFNSLIRSPFAEAIGSLGDSIFELFEGRGSGTFQGAVDLMGNSFDYLFGTNGLLTRAVSWLTNWIRNGGVQEAFESLTTWINEFTERFSTNMEAEGFWRAIGMEIERIIDNLFGAVNEDTGEREGGLANLIYRKMEELFDDVIAMVQPRIDQFLESVGLPATTAGGETLWAAIKERVGLDGAEPLMPQIGRMIEDFLFGEITSIEFRDGEEIENRSGGLIRTLTDGFNNLLTNNSTVVNAITESFRSLFTIAHDALMGVIGVEAGQTLDQWFRTTFSDISTRFDEIMATVNQTLTNFMTAIGFGNGTSLTTWFDTTWASVQETMTNIAGTISGAVDLIRQAFNLGEGGSLGDWITNTLANLSAWKDSQIATMRSLIGMQGTESFGDFVTRTISEIQTGIQTQIDETIASLRSLIGMQGTESFGDFVSRISEELGASVRDQIGQTISLIDSRMRSFLGMNAGDTFESYVSRMITTITESMTNLIQTAIDALRSYVRDYVSGVNQTGVDAALRSEQGISTPELAAELSRDLRGEGFLNPAEYPTFHADDLLGEALYERLVEAAGLSRMERGITSGGTVNQALLALERQAREGTITDEALQTLTEVGRILKNVDGFATGTNGFRDFGRASLSVLHGTEAVVPKNTPAGELLQAFYNMQNSNQPITTPAPAPSYNQSELITKIDQLNSIMSQVAEILVDQRDIQSRTMRNLKGLGTDLFRGAA